MEENGVWINLAVLVFGGVSIFAVLRSKVDTHHKVLFGDHGDLKFKTVEQCTFDKIALDQRCREKHAEEITKICLKIEIMRTEIKAHTELMAKILDRIMQDNGRRGYEQPDHKRMD